MAAIEITSFCTPAASKLRLKIGSREQLRHFLRVIQPEFLRVVYPLQSGLLDILYAEQLVTDTDQESMSGKDVNTRKDQARKLWFLLNKMPVTDFQSVVAPELIKNFPHIIPTEFVTQDPEDASPAEEVSKECLHHGIRDRIRDSSMADLLYHHACLNLEDYEDIVSGDFDNDIVWTKLFDSCVDHDLDTMTELLDGLRTLLEKYKVHIPDGLLDLVARGIPCTCDRVKHLLPGSPARPLRKVYSWIKKSPFWKSPRSSGTSFSKMDTRSSIRSTSISIDSASVCSDNVVDSGAMPTCTTQSDSCYAHADLSPVLEEGEESFSPKSYSVDDNRMDEVKEESDLSVRTHTQANTSTEKFAWSVEGGDVSAAVTESLQADNKMTSEACTEFGLQNKSSMSDCVVSVPDVLVNGKNDADDSLSDGNTGSTVVSMEEDNSCHTVAPFHSTRADSKRKLVCTQLPGAVGGILATLLIIGLVFVVFGPTNSVLRVTKPLLDYLEGLRQIALNHEERLQLLFNQTNFLFEEVQRIEKFLSQRRTII